MSRKICKIEGCGKEAIGRGLCPMHYYRLKRHGSAEPLIDRSRLSKTNPKLYKIYCAMHERCENPNCYSYKNYGGRGIKVCERWSGVYGLRHFVKDMGMRPEGTGKTGRALYSIDRIDVDGNYCPENCRWTLSHEQTANTTVKRKYSEHVGVSYIPKKDYWFAHIKINGKRYVKTAHSEEEAISKRIELEIKYLGRQITD